MRLLPLLAYSFALAAACASNGDEINDITPPPDGKQDGGISIDEGTPTALGILRVANTVSVPDLRAANLTQVQAEQVASTRPFATIAELTALRSLDEAGLKHLKDAATANGWTAPGFYEHPVNPDAFNAYDLIERADGTISAFAWLGTSLHFLRDIGTPFHRASRLEFSLSAPTTIRQDARISWQEARQSGDLYGLWLNPGNGTNRALTLVRLAAATLPASAFSVVNDGIERLTTVAFGVGEAAAFSVADDGVVSVVFSRSTHTDNLGPGLFLSRCQPTGLCAEERIYTHPNNGTIRFAYAAHGVEQIVAIADAVRFDRFNVMTRRSDGAWQGQEVVAFDNNNDGGFTLTVHGAQGRWWATAHNTRTGMVVFQRGADGQWNRTGLLPRLDAARPLQAVAGRSLTLALANRRFSEQNDFAGEDFTRGVAERVLRTGQIAVIDGRYLKRTTGAKPAFANATLGAGDATHGRDPCYWHQTYYPVSLDTYGYRALQIDGTVTIPAGQCIDVDRITGSGTLVLAGTENKPIMLRTQTFAPDVKIRATWTFIVTLPNRTLRSDISHTAVFGSRGMTLDHVSVARTPRHGQPTTDAEVSHSLDFSNTTGVARYNVTVRDSYFANIAGSMFTFDGSTNAVFERVTFENVERHGVVIWNNGMNDSRLTMRDVSFVNPGAAVAARSLTSEARSQLSLDLLGLSEAARRKIRERPEFPIDLTNVTIETTHQINNEAPPAIFLQTAVGTSRGISVHNSIGDAIHFDNSGLYELADSTLIGNGGRGLVVTAPIPAGLGECYLPPPTPTMPSPNPEIDPKVTRCQIANNAGAGIWVSTPHIPMQIRNNELHDNAAEAIIFAAGRGYSPEGPDPTCPAGWRLSTPTGIVPLSPETIIEDNNIQRNGATSNGIQFRSAHELGTIPMPRNFWGTSNAAAVSAAIQCVGACDTAPIRTAPAP